VPSTVGTSAEPIREPIREPRSHVDMVGTAGWPGVQPTGLVPDRTAGLGPTVHPRRYLPKVPTCADRHCEVPTWCRPALDNAARCLGVPPCRTRPAYVGAQFAVQGYSEGGGPQEVGKMVSRSLREEAMGMAMGMAKGVAWEAMEMGKRGARRRRTGSVGL
jgi:hypothetical protein